MSWYNPFSWGEKAQDNILDKDNGLLSQVGGWIGNMDYTAEERAEANAKTVGLVVDYAKSTISENSERSKARRDIAVMWIKVQLFLILATCVMAMFDMAKAEFLFKMATAGVMLAGTSAIIVFFFGSYGVTRYQESKNK